MSFVHLNTRSHASFQRSSIKPKKLIEKAKELGQDAVGLMDYGNVFNAISFYQAAKKAGVKPIMGVEVFFTIDNEQSRISKDRKTHHLALIAKNNQGWKNICRIVSESNLPENYFYKTRVDFNILEKYSEGIIALCGSSFDGLIPYHLYDKLDDDGVVYQAKATFKAKSLLRRLISIFGKDEVFLEIQDQGYEFQKELNDRLRKLAIENGVGCVATNNAHYVSAPNAEAHNTLMEMSYNDFNKITDTDFSREEFYLKSEDEMRELSFTDEEIEASAKIAEMCNVEIDLKKRRLPVYKHLEDGLTSFEQMKKLAEDGLRNMGLEGAEYKSRLSRELQDIDEMGFSDYFLIVWDVCSWIAKKGIKIGYGRGSAGGSLVSYALGITHIDPLKYDLLWERFLNKGRGGLPDIDTDVPRSKRKEVLEYIQERFGKDSVAQIVTFNGMKARAVLKEVFSVYGVPFEEANKITQLVPQKNDDHTAITLSQAVEKVPALKEYSEKYHAWFELAKELEGCYKSLGTHAAAVVISDTPFEESDYPICRAPDGKSLIFGYDMSTVDSLSLLKLDILGLSTLDDIKVASDLIMEREGVSIDRNSMPLDDPTTYDLISEGRTIGVFQIEKSLGRAWAKGVAPGNIEELSDLVSVIRPGPLDSGMGQSYKEVKRGDRIPDYIHNSLKPILDRTYSGCLYQEQVMEICSKIAGFNLYDADNVRKCIVKGSKILTYKNGYVPIEKLMTYSDRRVQVIDENNFRSYFEEVSDVQSTGSKMCYKITTISGYEIEATEDHKFLVDGRWVELKDIDPSDCIGVAHTTRTQGNSKVSRDEVVLAALLTSEGYTQKEEGGYFCNSDEWIVNKYMTAFNNHFGKKSDDEWNQGAVSLNAAEKNSLKELVTLGVSNEKAISDSIVNSSLSNVKAFLGLHLSADGWIAGGVYYCSASEQICRSIKRMLLRCGVYSTVYSKPNKRCDRYWYVSVSNLVEAKKLLDAIGEFVTPRKLILSDYKSLNTKSSERGDLIWDEVKSIECVGEKEVFDFSMSNTERPYAIVEDILTHNCMGKKKQDEMEKWKGRFVEGCAVTSDIEEDKAVEMWNFIEKFAGYGFNKSHGIGYALLAYETAFFKSNYPLEFFTAKLRNAKFAQDPTEEIKILINDAKLFGIEVTPPRVTSGNEDFDIIGDSEIAFGLTSLKGVGKTAIRPLRKLADVKDEDEFLWKSIEVKASKTVVETCIKSGALDNIGSDRVRMLAKYKLLQELTEAERKLVKRLWELSGVDDWTRPIAGISDDGRVESIKDKFDLDGLRMPNVRRREKLRSVLREYKNSELFDSLSQKIGWESYYIGIGLSGNPADIYRAANKCSDIAKYPSEGLKVEIAVTIESVREIVTKKEPPRPMAFVTAGDNTYMLDNIVVFPDTFSKFGNLLTIGAVLKIKGKLDDRGGLLVDNMQRIR